MPNPDNTFGLRISNSSMTVFLPANASTAPILVDMYDLPSPLKEEVVRITALSFLLRTYCRLERIILNCSATMLRVVLLTTSVLSE